MNDYSGVISFGIVMVLLGLILDIAAILTHNWLALTVATKIQIIGILIIIAASQ